MEVTRSIGWAAALVAVVALVLVVTRVDAGSGRARTDVLSATGAASLTKAVAGDAVLRTGPMKPGQRVSGTVSVKNDGDATGAFQLAQSDVLDTPGQGGGRLSTLVRLNVVDQTSGRRVYQGKLGAMAAYPLGYLRAGERRTYGFTVEFPSGAPPGDAYAGSQVETTFDWSAKTGEPGPARDTTPPTVLVQTTGTQGFDGRSLTVAITCSESCELDGLPSASGPGRLEAGHPTLVTIDLSRAKLPLRITAADPAGNRTTASAAVAAVP
jgi:hypothetical protein